MRLAAALALLLLAAACGTPSSVGKQAEHVASLGAEGALLAGGVADGRSFSPFVRTHARALHENAVTLRSSISDPRLRRVASEVVTELDRLASSASDRATAKEVEHRLAAAAERSKAIAAGAP
jgi:hypothetical protein